MIYFPVAIPLGMKKESKEEDKNYTRCEDLNNGELGLK